MSTITAPRICYSNNGIHFEWTNNKIEWIMYHHEYLFLLWLNFGTLQLTINVRMLHAKAIKGVSTAQYIIKREETGLNKYEKLLLLLS